MGEPPYHFITRLRMEKAAGLLRSHTGKSVSEIASLCGFTSASAFAKRFKQHFGMNASAWRDQSGSQAVSSTEGGCPTVRTQGGKPIWEYRIADGIRRVRIEDIAKIQVAYVRHVGPYVGESAVFAGLYEKLFRWAVPRGLADERTTTFNVYHDYPGITPGAKLRVMACIPVTGDVQASGEVGVTRIAGGRYAVCRLCLDSAGFAHAWEWVTAIWLPQSGYTWGHGEAFERCYGQHIEQGVRYFEVDIVIPVKPM